ncbi:hypothetical protein [Tuberibacillus sp. Marseille-P3662]|uniref:hypothetical protein n=1 Tax=Tuberibacillus sp. Marseille-P3662 TaxID=1965358 RepID=UPI000A1CD12F|nr:hypothetical protein [Tuberibacillus sp. Marseille-P3662]
MKDPWLKFTVYTLAAIFILALFIIIVPLLIPNESVGRRPSGPQMTTPINGMSVGGTTDASQSGGGTNRGPSMRMMMGMGGSTMTSGNTNQSDSQALPSNESHSSGSTSSSSPSELPGYLFTYLNPSSSPGLGAFFFYAFAGLIVLFLMALLIGLTGLVVAYFQRSRSYARRRNQNSQVTQQEG